jgi:Fe-S-cluster containining protein
MVWKCKQCGKCCKFIVIPVTNPVNLETESYLAAHGIAYDGNAVIIPARCKYLTDFGKCKIHNSKFTNCRLGGEKECKEAKKWWRILKNL